MHVFVRQLDDTTRLFEVNEGQLRNVEAVRAAVGVSDEAQYLSMGGVPLENASQLSENCTLDILIKVPGGQSLSTVKIKLKFDRIYCWVDDGLIYCYNFVIYLNYELKRVIVYRKGARIFGSSR